MAVSTEFTLSTYMRGILTLSEDSYSVQNNTSVVRYKLQVRRTNPEYYTGQTYTPSARRVINVNGQNVYDYTGEISHYASEGTKTIAEGTVTVAHNADGSKTVSGYASIDDPYTWFNGSSETISLALTTIPRASEPTIGQAGTNTPDFNLGDAITIYTNRKSSAFTHKVYITYDNTDHLIAQNVGVSTTYDTSAIEDAIAQLIPNANTYAGTIKVQTYNGATLIGTKTCPYVAHLVNAEPTFSDFSFRDANTTTVALTGNDQILVQNKSNLQVNISTAQKAVAKKHATMARYLMNCANLSDSVAYSASAISKNLGAPTSTGSQTVGVSAIDSRENATLVTKPVTVVPYTAPQIFATGARVNGFENDTTITIDANTAISPVKVNNVRKNSVQEFAYRYKKTTDSSYPSTWTSIAHTVDADGKITANSFVISLNNQYEYEIQFKLTDALETSYATAVISEGIAIFRIGTDGNCYVNEHRILTEDDLPLGTSNIADDAVTFPKIDFSTFGKVPSDIPTKLNTGVNLGHGTKITMTRVGCLVIANGTFVVSSTTGADGEASTETIPNGYRPTVDTYIPWTRTQGSANNEPAGMWLLKPSGATAYSCTASTTGAKRFAYSACWLTNDDFPS